MLKFGKCKAVVCVWVVVSLFVCVCVCVGVCVLYKWVTYRRSVGLSGEVPALAFDLVGQRPAAWIKSFT